MSKTLTWDEDVMLANGKLLSVHRTATFGPDEWFRPGRGRLTDQTISFESNGQRIKWKSSERYFSYLPHILDFANGMPIVVMPVHSWPACFKYDFPLEGFVAFGYKQGRWNRVAAADLPNDLSVNLLPETYAVRTWYKGKRVTVAEKEETNQKNGTRQGQSLPDASRVYAGYEQACIRMRPPPDKELDDSRQRNASAERSAPTIQASVLSADTEPQAVTKEMFAEQQGHWTGAGYLTKSCAGFVDKIEPLQQWAGDQNSYGSKLIGYRLVLSVAPNQKRKVQFDAGRVSMAGVVCDQSTVFVLRREAKEGLIVHRFDRNGDLIDAARIALPDTTVAVAGSKWGSLWNVVSDGEGNLSMSVVDYTYVSSANMGGTINRRVNYSARLPVR